MAAGSKFARNSPLLGEAFFTSAITAGLPAAIFARSAAVKSRSGGAAALRARKSARLTRRLRSATSSALRRRKRCSMSDILFKSPTISKKQHNTQPPPKKPKQDHKHGKARKD